MEIRTIGRHNDQPVLEARLENSRGVSIAVMSYGAIVRDWRVPTANGIARPVVLGFPTYEAYLNDPAHIGAIVGRVANRVAGAEFSIGDKHYKLAANVGTDQLHGGPTGLGRRNWKMAVENGAVVLRYHSADGEMGYPGSVDFTVKYLLEDFTLRLEIEARVSETTPINVVQHHYFNLMGRGTVLDHQVQIHGDRYTPLSDRLIPTGEIRPVQGTPFDFRGGRTLRKPDGTPAPYDVNFALAIDDRERDPVAIVTAPDSSLTLKLWTDQPGLQFYTSEYLDSVDVGWEGERYRKFGGLCLEDQMFPDALHHPAFPSILVSPDKPYRHWCEIEIK